MRKLATAAAVSLALASGGAFGLGLGDIEMRSALNQPMQAEIRLTAVKPGELDGMIVQLASADAYARAGIERSSVLTDLTFSVDRSGSVPVIRISSQRPVAEPFLNFLLEVDWQQGRMIREYTVLLDPPVFMTSTATSRNTAGDQAVVVQRGNEALVVPTPIDRDSSPVGEMVPLDLLSPPDGELVDLQALTDFDDSFASSSGGEFVSLSDLSAPNTRAIQERSQVNTEAFDGIEVELFSSIEEVSDAEGGFATESDGSIIVSLSDLGSSSTDFSGGDSIAVKQGDTLFEIARSTAVGGASVQQMMLALLKANESSFIEGNINLVKAGSTLQIPSVSEATRLNQAQAIVAISDQNQLWRDYRDQLLDGPATQLASIESSTQPSEEVELFVEDLASTATLSDQAQVLLDTTAAEISFREELMLVADNSSTSTSASATADESSTSTDQLGDINRRLQLAREDLSSTRLQSSDLTDQASELLQTTENLDSLVELRQTGIANLEAQLADARTNGGNAMDEAETIVGEIDESSGGLLTDVSGSAAEVVDSGTNALIAAGEDLGDVELYSEAGDVQGLQPDNQLSSQPLSLTPPAQQTAWYQNLLTQPIKLLMAAAGLLGAIGLAALLLWRRRRADDVDEENAFAGDVGFINDEEAAELQAELNQDRFDEIDEFDDFGEVRTATVANKDFDGTLSAFDAVASKNVEFDESTEDHQNFEFGEELPDVERSAADSSLDPDNTISEADVYLNYGLHGQAEELLNKAVESQPNNPDYARKLLETYHGQGNGDKYLAAAKNFHARFGGDSNPEWNSIAIDGVGLLPDEPLFGNVVAKAEVANADFPNAQAKFTDDDFLPATESDTGSINRSFDAASNSDRVAEIVDKDSAGIDLKAPVVAASAAVAAGFASLTSNEESVGFDADETDLMDQSLDPAFAFDEADLEATGDFSQIADELAAEAGDNIDFPSFDDTVALPASSENFLDATIADTDSLSDALTIDEIDGVIGSADELTLDLDQLSDDLKLDSAEFMNSDLSDIELPDLSLGDELNASDVVSRAASSDSEAMGTMLDLAKAYIDMGDKDSASSALDEIVKSGTPAQVTEAEDLLSKIS